MLIISLPIFIIVGLLIKLDSIGPIFFIQKRVGKNLKEFNLIKFRTMTNEKRTVPNKPVIGKADGVTSVGYYLRRYKIDEMPQFFNVLLGDMSIVGPRPSIYSHLQDMNEEEKKRYSVRPGLTGLAQVSGNIHLSWKERFNYDLQYVRSISLTTDLKIILRTILIMVLGEDKFINKPL